MHELGILFQVLKTVEKAANDNKIRHIKHITLEVGRQSEVVPDYLEKLYPVAVENYPFAKKAKLNISMIEGKGLYIKDIGY